MRELSKYTCAWESTAEEVTRDKNNIYWPVWWFDRLLEENVRKERERTQKPCYFFLSIQVESHPAFNWIAMLLLILETIKSPFNMRDAKRLFVTQRTKFEALPRASAWSYLLVYCVLFLLTRIASLPLMIASSIGVVDKQVTMKNASLHRLRATIGRVRKAEHCLFNHAREFAGSRPYMTGRPVIIDAYACALNYNAPLAIAPLARTHTRKYANEREHNI